jgi:PAS domain S-box-containing protein
MSSEDPSRLPSQKEGERFDLLATDATEYAVFLFGLDGKLLCWNAGAEGLFGYHSTEIIGQHFSRFFTPKDIVTGQPEHELKTAVAHGRTKSTRWPISAFRERVGDTANSYV